ncbi:MAG: penicillin acylase family protein [Microthrixaceae bacterium]
MSDHEFRAEIRVTTHGVPHVRADDWAGLGYGQGWACARDHLPAIADQIVKVRGERARFHGPGAQDGLLASDLGYRVLGLRERAAGLRDAQPPWIRELVTGYTAGYNRAVDEALDAGPGALPEWCDGAEWIRRVDELDLYAWFGDVALMASGRNVAQLIGHARPPGPDGPHPPAPLEALAPPSVASNGWAVGGDVTASGHGMVLANPHFPWYGEARFWECHLTIPGVIDAYGVSLLGTPGIQMGFNRHVAWAHTFSCGHRFTLYRLDLDPDDPTRYRHGDEWREMRSETHSVEVAGGGTVERTLWRTHLGPMLNLPLLGWGHEVAFTFRDANEHNTRVLEQFLGMDMADSLDSFRRVFHEVQGLPWVNTLAADAEGTAWYADMSATPRLTPGAQDRFRARITEDLVAALLYENRIALLDGSDPDDEWQDHPGARSPGLEPPAALPQLARRDVLVNANDSHWLTHPREPLEGYPVLCGLERTPRTLRTRQNLRQAAALSARGGITVGDLLDAVYDGPSLSAQLLAAAVADRCRAAGAFTVAGQEVDGPAVAAVLERWDGRVDLDSAGAVLWREFMDAFEPAQWRDAGPVFAVGFDPDDPVVTPHTLAPAPVGTDPAGDPVLQAVGHAVRVLAEAGLAPGVALGDAQWAARGERRVPVPGGGEGEGVMNVLGPTGALPPASLEPGPPRPAPVPGRERTGLAQGGYQVTYGASFLMAVEMTPDGPNGVGLLAYGQNGDPRSPHHADGTEAFAGRAVRPLRFTDADIEADPELERISLRGSAGG